MGTGGSEGSTEAVWPAPPEEVLAVTLVVTNGLRLLLPNTSRSIGSRSWGQEVVLHVM